MHYHRDAFNHIFDQVTAESDRKKRIQLLKECDQIIQKDAPIIPILTNDFLIMVNSRIRNFKTNPMELLDFSTIFIREPRQL
jgi:ABC-type transport system substrate-binding protein